MIACYDLAMPDIEKNTEPVTVMLPPSVKAAVLAESARSGIPTSILLRNVVIAWLAALAKDGDR